VVGGVAEPVSEAIALRTPELDADATGAEDCDTWASWVLVDSTSPSYAGGPSFMRRPVRDHPNGSKTRTPVRSSSCKIALITASYLGPAGLAARLRALAGAPDSLEAAA
jgi:hypothetical protein